MNSIARKNWPSISPASSTGTRLPWLSLTTTLASSDEASGELLVRQVAKDCFDNTELFQLLPTAEGEVQLTHATFGEGRQQNVLYRTAADMLWRIAT